jgi:UDP-N-acetylglucosamine--dolichyl-phosphate N-acetylglucosaminephosphotransferase
MELSYIMGLAGAFLLSLLTIAKCRKRFLSLGIVGIDINKDNGPRVAEGGGVLLLPAIWITVVSFVSLKLINPVAYVFLFVVTCFAAVGFFDDGFKLFKREAGWGRYVANRGIILFLFTVAFTYLVMPAILNGCAPCVLYWIVVFGGLLILATASLTNSFAGLNGWEVGSSLVVLAALTVMASFSQIYTSTLITLCLVMLGSVAALFYFNKYPSRIFPGDSGTLLIGAFAGCMILFIDYWYIALALFFPHAFDILLKLKTNPRDMSQKRGKPYVWKEGKLNVPQSGKLDFAKYIVSKLGPRSETRAVSRIHRIVINNALFWTLLYILIKIV